MQHEKVEKNVGLMAVLIAIVLAVFLLPYFNDIAGKQLAIHLSDLWFIVPILIGVAIVVGVLAGSYPAFFLASFQPVRVLKGSGTRRADFMVLTDRCELASNSLIDSISSPKNSIRTG